jgi:hypothetical protein
MGHLLWMQAWLIWLGHHITDAISEPSNVVTAL